ncbi:MAG TPA: hypothetical protein VIJ99_02305 [Acidimicrobiales bacterium]
MRFVVADLWGNVATPSATVSVLHEPPADLDDADEDKVGFTFDVTQRLGGAILQDTSTSAVTPLVRPTSLSLADSA